jgi:putative thioredoxin
MSEQDVFIFEISKRSFNSSVILNSYKIPVFVEFIGVWSEPCIRLADSLADLAKEFAGQFIFAKVDIDEQPELAKEYGIENVPTLKVFKDGEVVRNEEGLIQEDELRALLKTYGVSRQSDELREQARQKHIAGKTVEAISLLTQAIQQDPSNTRVAMDMVQVLLDIGELEQAKALFNKLPDTDKETDTGKALLGQLTFMDLATKTEGKTALAARIETNAKDYDARFDLAICLVAEHDYQQAMEHLFAIVDKHPEYKDGAAREMIANLSNMLATSEPVLAQECRRRLGSALA